MRRKALLAGAVAALITILVILSRMAAAPSFALLYAGLDPAAAGEVIAALDARGVANEVRGDSIYVDQSRRDELRMALAGEGLPATGSAGYELLDGLSGFGTTSQMFDAAYWRAREGELARTILSSPQVRAARVHLANPGADPFAPRTEVTASVTLRPAAGGIGPSQARALRYLVASSVPGLRPENVTVIDADSGQMIGGQTAAAPNEEAAARAETLRRNIARLLSARVGPGNAVVEVNVEVETDTETVIERRIDPESRVVIATDTEERSNASRDAARAAVTVASNLPDGDAAGSGGNSSSENTESRERVTFDVSELQREVASAPGGIRRIGVAVLVNGLPSVNENGRAVVEPRPQEELAALEALVQSAIGYDAARGDQVTIRSMAFVPPEDVPLAEAGGGLFSGPIDVARLVQVALLSLVALAVAMFVVRPALQLRELPLPDALPAPPPGGLSAPAPAPAPAPAVGAPEAAIPPPAPVLAAGAAPAVGAPLPAVAQAAPAEPRAAALPEAAPAPGLPAPPEAVPDPVDRLRRLIDERSEETVEILRSWMDEDEEPA